jgi:LysM repeat protein
MDTNDSNIKSQQTGGLKLMTVFIAVLALHVVVIGGFTVYHLMSGGTTDADLITTDKTHKDLKGADGSMIADSTTPTASQGDKRAPASTSSIEAATTPANPLMDQVATTEVTAPTPAPVEASAPAVVPALIPVLAPPPALTLTAPKPALLAPPALVATHGAQTPTGPISPELAPPAEPVPAPLASLTAGPVHMPSVASSPAAPKIEREHQQTYTVKITDSYKKIAHSHHVTVAQLKEANHIKGDMLHTGQKLIIPSTGALVATTAPAASATDLDSTPTRTVLNESTPAATASLAAAPSTVATTGTHHHLYMIVKGDTLSKIAHKFKTTTSAIMSENSITDPAKLTIGKKLKIPSSESRSARITAPAAAQPSQVQAKEKASAPSAQLANFVP